LFISSSRKEPSSTLSIPVFLRFLLKKPFPQPILRIKTSHSQFLQFILSYCLCCE
jgi:hypothetical protein